jgi:site-specific DNA-methyltransferase (adenine-specific)
MKLTEKIQITNEDNMELMARYPDNHFDLAIVDPPYGIERFKNVTTTPSSKDVHAKRFQRMETVNNDKPSDEYWSELFRVSKNQIVWGANNFELPPSEYFLCWNKEQAMPNFATLEYAWVSMGLKKPAKLFTYSIHKHNQVDKVHPTQKPVALYKWLLDKYAKPNDKILDTHLGSGSIAIACHDYGFELTACELDKEYYDKAIKRIQNHVSQQKLF